MTVFQPSLEQQDVIAHPLEPLRVMAGAGTGKTSTVAHRIAWLISEHGLEPEQVLGMTFTNKAAEELAQRVRVVLGDGMDAGRQVEIHTYHGFAAQLLREFGALVGVENKTSVITPTFTRQILGEIMASMPLPNLNQTYPGTVDLMRRLAAQMSDNLVTVDQVSALTDADVEVLAKRRDLLKGIRRYSEVKQRFEVVDYGDLISSAARLVTENPWLVQRIRGRYRSVVLDEYQDTNPAQRILLTTIFAEGFPVTAVGDPDQTIYEWRGASMANFEHFPEHFPSTSGDPAMTLPLTLNRRSGHAILDVANTIRDRIDGPPRPRLRAIEQAEDGEVGCAWFVDAVAEADWIADDVMARHKMGVRWKDIGILFRKNKDMAVIRDALAARNIPVEVANLGGLLSVPEVVEIHAWLRLLNSPDDGPALGRILTGSMHRLGLGDLAVLTRWAKTTRHANRDGDQPDGNHRGADTAVLATTMLEAIDHLDEIDGLSAAAHGRLERFRDRFQTLIVAAQSTTLAELSRLVLDVTGAWEDIEALSDAARLSARLNLYRFLDLAEQWSPLEGRPSLSAFLDYLSIMDEEPSEELDTARLAGADAVTLLTVHRAKGLEWPVVYVPGTRHNTFPSGVTGSYDNPLTRPESLPYRLRLDCEYLPAITPEQSEDEQRSLLRERHVAQEWRIAYVAATRARSSLTFTGAYWYGQPEPTVRPGRPSALYELIEGSPVTRVLVDTPEPGERPETLRSDDGRLAAPDPFFDDGGWQDALRRAMDDERYAEQLAIKAGIESAYAESADDLQGLLFALPEPVPTESERTSSTSVTGLVTYKSCPKRFYWSEVDRLPRRQSKAAMRGVDVHRRIELHHRGVMPLEELQTDLYDTTPEEQAHPQQTQADQTPAYQDSASQDLANQAAQKPPFEVFLESRFADLRPHLIESPFELRLGTNTSIRGRVDAVYRHTSTDSAQPPAWEIVDFKSGKPSNDPAAIVQLQAYALALDGGALVPERADVIRVTFAYLGEGLTERSQEVDAEWLSDAANSLGSLAAAIEREQFDPEPGPGCRTCDFFTFCPEGQAYRSTNRGL